MNAIEKLRKKIAETLRQKYTLEEGKAVAVEQWNKRIKEVEGSLHEMVKQEQDGMVQGTIEEVIDAEADADADRITKAGEAQVIDAEVVPTTPALPANVNPEAKRRAKRSTFREVKCINCNTTFETDDATLILCSTCRDKKGKRGRKPRGRK